MPGISNTNFLKKAYVSVLVAQLLDSRSQMAEEDCKALVITFTIRRREPELTDVALSDLFRDLDVSTIHGSE